jgi:Zn-dependent alcohol dehydrogenases
MKAAILYKPLSLEVKEVDIPRPKSKELVIKVDTSGLCPSDVKVYRYGGYNVKYPVILGHEVSGEVYSIGDGVEGFKEKDKV